MRRPLTGNPIITTRHGTPGYGHFGKHAGYDYGVGTGTPLYAPVSGRILAISSGSSGGNIIELDGEGLSHRFLHLQHIQVRSGQQVSEGQQIGTTGATGQVTGPHLHHDVRRQRTNWNADYNNYVDWEAMLRTPAPAPTKTQGADEMIANADQAIKIYKMLRPNGAPNQNEINGTAGRRTYAQFVNDAQKEIAARDANIRNQAAQVSTLQNNLNAISQTATAVQAERDAARKQAQELSETIKSLREELQAANNRPPETVIKEVEKIVDNCELPDDPKEPTAPWYIKLLAKFVKPKPPTSENHL